MARKKRGRNGQGDGNRHQGNQRRFRNARGPLNRGQHRNSRRGVSVFVADRANGWADSSRAIDTIEREVSTHLESRHMETESEKTALDYVKRRNKMLYSFPLCLLVPLLGLRRWEYIKRKPQQRRRRRTKGRR